MGSRLRVGRSSKNGVGRASHLRSGGSPSGIIWMRFMRDSVGFPNNYYVRRHYAYGGVWTWLEDLQRWEAWAADKGTSAQTDTTGLGGTDPQIDFFDADFFEKTNVDWWEAEFVHLDVETPADANDVNSNIRPHGYRTGAITNMPIFSSGFGTISTADLITRFEALRAEQHVTHIYVQTHFHNNALESGQPPIGDQVLIIGQANWDGFIAYLKTNYAHVVLFKDVFSTHEDWLLRAFFNLRKTVKRHQFIQGPPLLLQPPTFLAGTRPISGRFLQADTTGLSNDTIDMISNFSQGHTSEGRHGGGVGDATLTPRIIGAVNKVKKFRFTGQDGVIFNPPTPQEVIDFDLPFGLTTQRVDFFGINRRRVQQLDPSDLSVIQEEFQIVGPAYLFGQNLIIDTDDPTDGLLELFNEQDGLLTSLRTYIKISICRITGFEPFHCCQSACQNWAECAAWCLVNCEDMGFPCP